MILGMLGYIAHALIRHSAAIYEKTVNAGSGGSCSRHRGLLSETFAEQFRHENEARLKALAGEAQQKAAVALREQLIEVAFAHAAAASKRRWRPSRRCAMD